MDTRKFLALVEKKTKEAQSKNVATSDWAKKLEKAAMGPTDEELARKKKKEKKRRRERERASSRERHRRRSSSRSESSDESSSSDGERRERRKEKKKSKALAAGCDSKDGTTSDEKTHKRRHRKKHESTVSSSSDSDGSDSDRGAHKRKQDREHSRERSTERSRERRRKKSREKNREASRERQASDKELFSGDDAGGRKRKEKSKSRTPEPAFLAGSSNGFASLPPLPRPRKSVTPEPGLAAKRTTVPNVENGGACSVTGQAKEGDGLNTATEIGVGLCDGSPASLGMVDPRGDSGVGAGSRPVVAVEEEIEKARNRALASLARKGKDSGDAGEEVGVPPGCDTS